MTTLQILLFFSMPIGAALIGVGAYILTTPSKTPAPARARGRR
jgi:hypothetical protein